MQSYATNSGGSFFAGLINQTRDGRRQLRADALPVSQAILHNAESLFTAGSNWIVKPDAFNEAAIAAIARIGSDDVEKRALLGASTS